MRLGRFVLAGLVALALPAWADRNDLELYRLGQPGSAPGSPADLDFQILARQLGASMTSANLMPPSTLGHSGFAVNLELSVVGLGARPADDPEAYGTDAFAYPSEQQGFAPDSLLIPSVHVRKGLPFSTEIGGRIAWVERSRMYAATVELKGAINEGFAALPDVALRGYVTRLFNARELSMTATGVDLGIGKKFPIGGMITLNPYVGWNLVFVGAESARVDFRPDRSLDDAFATPGAQLADTDVFEPLGGGANVHNRFYVGGRFVGGVVQIGLELSYSGLGQLDYANLVRPLPAVTAFNSTIGLDF